MQHGRLSVFCLVVFTTLLLLFFFGSCGEKKINTIEATNSLYKEVTDMRGITVRIPADPKRIISVSDGMVETILAHFNMIDRLVALGSSCVQRSFTYQIPGKTEELVYTEGMNPIRLLYPQTAELPLIASSGLPLELERIASYRPDLIILREGCCTIPNLGDPKSKQALATLESMEIPVVVLKGTTQFDPPDLSKFYKEIELLGEILNQPFKASELRQYIQETIDRIEQQTKNASETGIQPRLLYLGLSPKAREGGSAGVTKGNDTMEGYSISQLIHAKNAFEGMGGRTSSLMINTEQLLTIDPDVIVLPTSSGYHPPEELYEASYYTNLKSLKAVNTKRVIALPWTPCNCSKRIEFPIELMMMAKAAYPDAFQDIDFSEWVLDFYQRVYLVDEITAKKIRSAQWLDWTVNTF